MAKFDPEREAHKSWLGLLQPVGLVVSAPALIKAQAVLDKNVVPLQQAMLGCVEHPTSPTGTLIDDDPVLRDFPRFAHEVLGWHIEDLAGAPGGSELAPELTVVLPDYHDTLRPTYAVLDPVVLGANGKVLMLVEVVGTGTDLDGTPPDAGTGWHTSPQARLERLLRDTSVSAGLLLNGKELRLVYAPRGESSGHIGFPIAEMCKVGGRHILAAMHMLLSEHRVFGAPNGQRLLDLLVESRKYQSEVSNDLAEQVLGALWELLRGFQAADEAAHRQVLYDLATSDPNHIYGGVLTVIMRLVFLLYAEDRGLMPNSAVYANNYAIGGLYERLREDAGRYPDTMDQRYGAWAWLLSTFRLVFDGGGHAGLHLPTRHGQLFNPDEYPFLEGRKSNVLRVMGDTFEAPKVSDGVIWRVLEGLLMLDGERLSYRTLDVEQIGSVYESMMGFEVETTEGQAIAVRPKHVVFDIDALLAEAPAKRAAWLKDKTECDLSGGAATALKDAKTADDVVAALGRKVSPTTPRLLAPGALFLQPGEERRRSGSHYTPRELTEPIVRTTLRPILEALATSKGGATPDQILELKVCDPAMGSGAFLVEACRQLAEALVAAWELHRQMPRLPPDEDPLLHARRLIAQRCLYGVDKNPFAVNLAKLSLWLVTLARDHAFTFLDHALKYGDSLVGLTKEQIGAFHWAPPNKDQGPLFAGITTSVNDASLWRRRLFGVDEGDYLGKSEAWRESEDDLAAVRLVGDACIAAYFGADKDKDRDRLRLAVRHEVDRWRAGESDGIALRERIAELRSGARPVPAFHWEIEFPEVFERVSPGFDAMVGNPPFAGKNTIASGNRPAFLDWLKHVHPGAHGNADLVAHFFRRAFLLLRRNGTFGLIATNTIAQGDTRSTGLAAICQSGGDIYAARRRVKWPGLAAVVVSVVHVLKGPCSGPRSLDDKQVPLITAFLFHGGGHTDPAPLKANEGKSFVGSYVLGMGFTFDDTNDEATPIAEMHRLIAKDPQNAERIFPYIGGEEVNSSPNHAHHRYVINFGELSEDKARGWPDLMTIAERLVKPGRLRQNDRGAKESWWQFIRVRGELHAAIAGLDRVLAISLVSNKLQFTFLASGMVYSHKLAVFPLPKWSAFTVLQSNVHEVWGRFFSSTMKDDINYSPSDCFETFPFPKNWTTDPTLEAAGKTYYELRAALMVRNDQGLTKTYNRFHDPNEHDPDILKLRELHTAMDRAVLDAYGWTDIAPNASGACEFLLDYAIDEATLANWGNKKKPYRYRWPDAVHDEVLARLLDLNQKRHLEEQAAGPKEQAAKKKAAAKPAKTAPKQAASSSPKKPAATPKQPTPGTLALFDDNDT